MFRKSSSALKPFSTIQLRKSVFLGNRFFSNLYHPHLASLTTGSSAFTGFLGTYFLTGAEGWYPSSRYSTGNTRKFSQSSIQKQRGLLNSRHPSNFMIFSAASGFVMKQPVPIPRPYSSLSMITLRIPSAWALQALRTYSLRALQGRLRKQTLSNCPQGYASRLYRFLIIAAPSCYRAYSSSSESPLGGPNSASQGSDQALSSDCYECEQSEWECESEEEGGSSGSPCSLQQLPYSSSQPPQRSKRKTWGQSAMVKPVPSGNSLYTSKRSG